MSNLSFHTAKKSKVKFLEAWCKDFPKPWNPHIWILLSNLSVDSLISLLFSPRWVQDVWISAPVFFFLSKTNCGGKQWNQANKLPSALSSKHSLSEPAELYPRWPPPLPDRTPQAPLRLGVSANVRPCLWMGWLMTMHFLLHWHLKFFWIKALS